MIGFGVALEMMSVAPPAVFMGETIPQRACAICDTASSMCSEYAAMGGRPVCGECANVVANIFSYYHGGAYLTWPNPESTKAGYRKKDIPEALRWQIFERDDFRCKHCGSRHQLRADHIIPESKGGETSIENLQTLCHRCNSRKGAR